MAPLAKGPDLRSVELLVEAAPQQQFRLRALLHQLALVQHEDQVGVVQGGEAVGDHEGGAAHHQPVERVENHGLGLGIHRRG